MSAEVDIECSICLDKFQDPRILKCGHTFCKRCLESLLQSLPDDNEILHLNCPECNAKVNVSKGLDKLTINWVAKKAGIKSLDIPDAPSSAQPQTQPTSSIPACQNHNDQCIMHCRECAQLICTKCLSQHSAHLGDIGPIVDVESVYKDIKVSLSDKVSSVMTDLGSKIEYWSEAKERVSHFYWMQHAFLETIESSIQTLEQKCDEMRSQIRKRSKNLEKITESSIEVLKESKSAVSILSEHLNTKVSASNPSIHDWDLVHEVSKGVIANSHLELKFEDIDDEEVFAIKRSQIGQILEQIEALQLVQYKLPLPMRFSDEFEVVIRNATSLEDKERIDSEWVSFGPLEFSVGLHTDHWHFGMSLFINSPYNDRALQATSTMRVRKLAGFGKEPTVTINGTFTNGKGCRADGSCPAHVLFKPENGFLMDDTFRVLVKFEISGLV